jgi:hypothetical protein
MEFANGEPKPDTIIESIQEVDSRRGSVKVIWPMSSVWSNAKGFGISMKAEVMIRQNTSNAFALTWRRRRLTMLLEPSDDEA